MFDIILATGNQGKVNEIQSQINGLYRLISMKDAGFEEELEEDHDNLEDNALQKANFIYQKTGKPCVAEDTGLFVPSLNGEPGVYSARYAGEQKDNQANMDLLLKKLSNQELSRAAYFKTVLVFMNQGKASFFTGELHGTIGFEKRGDKGFGYDPVFIIDDGRTLAEISTQEKTKISHRALAVNEFINYLNTLKLLS